MTIPERRSRPETAVPDGDSGTAADQRPTVLLVGATSAVDQALASKGPAARVRSVEPDEFVGSLRAEPPAVLYLGQGLEAERIASVADLLPARAKTRIVVEAGDERALQEALRTAGDRLFYGCVGALPAEDLVALLGAALVAPSSEREDDLEADDGDLASILRVAQVLARAPSLRPALQELRGALRELFDATDSVVLLHERDGDRLWGPPLRGEEGQVEEDSSLGLAGFVLRTGRPTRQERMGDDPRHHPATDGAPDHRFLCVRVEGTRRGLAAVLVVTRSPDRPAFGEAEQERLVRLAEEVAAPLSRLVLEDRVEQREAQRHGVFGSEARDMYRDRAIERYVGGDSDRSDVLRIAPSWIRWTYRLLLIIFGAALLYVVLGTTKEYAIGPGLVRVGPNGPRVLALLPGADRLAVRPRTEMRFTLDGDSGQWVVRLDRVADEVVGAKEGLERLGGPLPEAGSVSGPVFVVGAPLPKADDGVSYYSGMTGQAEVVIGSRRLIYRLLPSLERIIGSFHG